MAEAAPRVPEMLWYARTAAPAAKVWGWRCFTDLRRGIVDKIYHVVEMMHQGNNEGVTGSGTVIGREGLAVGGESAIMSPYTTADAEYVHREAAAAQLPRYTGVKDGIYLLLRSLLRTRAGGQAATSGKRAQATTPTAAPRRKGSTVCR